MKHRGQVLIALSLGTAFGFAAATLLMASGCSLLFLATARASDSVTVECDGTGIASHDYPGLTPERLTNMSAVLSDSPTASRQVPITAHGDTASVPCDAPGKGSVLFVEH